MELETVLRSNLFSQDDYIKRYLEGPELPFITVIKIGLRYYILGDLILQLQTLKEYLGVQSFEKYYLFKAKRLLP